MQGDLVQVLFKKCLHGCRLNFPDLLLPLRLLFLDALLSLGVGGSEGGAAFGVDFARSSLRCRKNCFMKIGTGADASAHNAISCKYLCNNICTVVGEWHHGYFCLGYFFDTLRRCEKDGSEGVAALCSGFLRTIVILMPENASVSLRTLPFFFPLVTNTFSSFNACVHSQWGGVNPWRRFCLDPRTRLRQVSFTVSLPPGTRSSLLNQLLHSIDGANQRSLYPEPRPTQATQLREHLCADLLVHGEIIGKSSLHDDSAKHHNDKNHPVLPVMNIPVETNDLQQHNTARTAAARTAQTHRQLTAEGTDTCTDKKKTRKKNQKRQKQVETGEREERKQGETVREKEEGQRERESIPCYYDCHYYTCSLLLIRLLLPPPHNHNNKVTQSHRRYFSGCHVSARRRKERRLCGVLTCGTGSRPLPWSCPQCTTRAHKGVWRVVRHSTQPGPQLGCERAACPRSLGTPSPLTPRLAADDSLDASALAVP